MSTSANFFDTRIEFLKGVGPQKATLLQTELQIFTFGDLLEHYPFRHEDRTRFYKISQIDESMTYVQLYGRVVKKEMVGEGTKKRLVALLQDETGVVEMVWFQGYQWADKKITVGSLYVIFGRPNRFNDRFNLPHPEIETPEEAKERAGAFEPVYSITEKLRKRYIDSRAIARFQRALLAQAEGHIHEPLPPALLEAYGLMGKQEAVFQAHFPTDGPSLAKAVARLKFEELFMIQMRLLSLKNNRQECYPGQVFSRLPLFKQFYEHHLPFQLTEAQKRVIREIYDDMRSGLQMNRLLQGDVGSGKTIVAFCCMLMAIDNGAQACLMAPTEILSIQHYNGLKPYAETLGLSITLLTGSTRKSERKLIHEGLLNGSIHIAVGTHALLEDTVDFQNLGLCIIDEQHRFGVAQRAKLWKKQSNAFPHILVMTATPIPRTLAMTLYGDLETSVIDQLPAGRKPIITSWRSENQRLRVFGFIQEQIQAGRQAYIVYPLIEESETLDYQNLMQGYENICRAFPGVPVSIVHGRMKPADKDFEMQRFLAGETKIMVATTVIEVGVNVPNASVMVIENAEKFGLSQLHQLRGRVGRGAEQSYCILMTGLKVSKEGRTRLETMVRTNDGFEIADVDLKLRGPGDLSGTQQSGVVNLKFADLARDSELIQETRYAASQILERDRSLSLPEHAPLREQLSKVENRGAFSWSRIS